MDFVPILSQAAEAPSLMRMLLRPDVLGALIPIVAIVVVGAIVIVKAVIRHRERMGKIQMGIDPDASREDGQRLHA